MKKRIKSISLLCCAMAMSVNAIEKNDQIEQTPVVKATKTKKLEEPSKHLTLEEAFRAGKVSGTIGSYGEFTDYSKGGEKKDFGWLTGYLKLKYETARWNKLKLGVEFIGHTQLADGSQTSKDLYTKDIEKKTDVSQIYLDYLLSEKTNIRFGRFNHKKFTHIDDAQSEGIYLQSKEIDNLDLVIGVITRFAELDYDDMEGFGQKDGKQDLSDDEHYGDSDDYLFFAELTYKLGIAEFNPFLYYQGGYATVYGMDTVLDGAITEQVNLGMNIYAYGVNIDKGTDNEFDDKKDGYGFNLEPFVKVADLKLSIGYAGLGGSREGSVNKPAWFRDYLTGFDQDKAYTAQNVDALYAKVYWKSGKWKAHVLFGHYTYNSTDDYDEDGESNELELQATYKIMKNLDINGRYFYVNYAQDIDDKDYQKVEARLRYKF